MAEKEKVYLDFTYPRAGGTQTIPTGTTAINFFDGSVILGNDTTNSLAGGLKNHNLKYVHSFVVEPNRSVIVYTDRTKGKYTVGANDVYAQGFQSFQQIFIEATASTDIRVWASTSDEPFTLSSRTSVGILEHINGTVGTTASAVTPSGTATSILINNTHAVNNLFASFDSGTTYKTITPNGDLEVGNCNVTSWLLYGSAAGTTYESLLTYR